jgi:hypothetical protein
MRQLILLGCLLVLGPGSSGQTKLNLQSQSKNVDFSAAASASPMPVGAMLPATCSTGQAFFLTSAPAGANLYWCIPANTWVLEGGSSSGGTGGLTYCAPASGSGSAYTCTALNAPAALAAGQVYVFFPDVSSSSAAPSLNMNGLGARAIVRRDGSGLVVGEIQQSVPLLLEYNGTAFLKAEPTVQAGGNGTLTCNFSVNPPTCDTTALVPTTSGTNLYTGANDFSSASLFNVRVAPGGTANADGAVVYDSTNKNTHVRSNGGDGIAGVFASPPSNGHCVQSNVTAGTVQLTDSGGGCGGGSGGNPAALCSGAGSSTNSTTPYTTVASCSVAGLTVGDMLHVTAHWLHNNSSTTDWQAVFQLGGTTVATYRASGDLAGSGSAAGEAYIFDEIWIYFTGSSTELIRGCAHRAQHNNLTTCSTVDTQGSGLPTFSATVNLSSAFNLTLGVFFAGTPGGTETIGIPAFTVEKYGKTP